MLLTPVTTKILNAIQNVENGVDVVVKVGHTMSLEIAPINRAHKSSFLLAFHSNYVPVLHRFWDITKYLSKIAVYLAPPSGVTPLEFRVDYWQQKTRVPGLSYCVVCVILHLAVLIQYWRVTDGRTFGQTDRQTTTACTTLVKDLKTLV